jgi:arylsulfatase A-like enzyme
MPIRALLALAAASLVPPLWLSAGGGGDLDLPGGLRVSWYQVLPAAVPLAAALLALAAGPPARSWRRALFAAGGLCLLGASAILWTGGWRGETLDLDNPLRPAGLGAALCLLACIPSRAGRPRTAAGAGWVVGAMGVGATLTLLLPVADRADLRAHMTPTAAGPAGPDLIVLVVDTLRADALGAYGAQPSPSPFLDALAARSLLAERALAQAPWTFASVASLFTSRYPTSLDPDGVGFSRKIEDTLPRIDDAVPRLARHLARAGYHTAGFQKNGFLEAGSGHEVGFDVYEQVGGNPSEKRAAAQSVDATLRWAGVFAEWRAENPETPFLLYVHFMDPHTNYQPPAVYWSDEARAYSGPMDGSATRLAALVRGDERPSRDDVAQLQRLYRGEVAYLDDQVARLHESLAALGLWSDETLVLFTADHGEQFFEHGGFEHGDLWIENLHVPLWFTGPPFPAKRIPGPTPLLDAVPTLLDAGGLPSLPGAEGRSLLGRGSDTETARAPVVSEFGARSRITGPRYTLIREPDAGLLFDAESDPAERRDLAAEQPDTAAGLRALLEQHEDRAPEGGGPRDTTRPLSEDTRRQLEALGYLDPDARP